MVDRPGGLCGLRKGVAGTAYTVRPAAPDDIEAVRRVARSAWEHTYAAIYPAQVIERFVGEAYAAANLRAAIERDEARPQRTFLVAVGPSGAVVAFAHAVPDGSDPAVFELARIYAEPQAQGTGVGGALLQSLLAAAPALRELGAWVEAENAPGRRFYERHGFRAGEEQVEELFGHPARLVRYRWTRPTARPR